MKYFSPFTFEQELSLGYHFLHMGRTDKACNHYFSIIPLATADMSAKGQLHGFLIDLIAAILKVEIDYYISITDQGYSVEYNMGNAFLLTLLDKEKYPWVDKVGLSLIIRKILKFNHNQPEWDDKLFLRPYGNNSTLRFGINEGESLSSVLINNPEDLLKCVNELYHFYLSFQTLIDSNLVAYILAKNEPILYWRIAARCILKDIVNHSLYHVRDRMRSHNYELEKEHRQAQKDADEWFNIAYEGDASNL